VGSIKAGWAKVSELVQELLKTRRGLIIAGLGVLVLLLLCLIAIFSAMNHNRGIRPDNSRELSDVLGPQVIPPEDLFLPGEPDFLPEVLLEREPAPLTAEDARSFWTDPLEKGDELWRERIKTVIDDLLEPVP
jgi:hypothetical protein